MNTRLCRIAILLASVLCASTASAAFNFTGHTQTRWVHGEVSGALAPTISQTINAPNSPALFNATTTVTDPTYGGAANQHQRSELLPGSISVLTDINSGFGRPAEVGTGIAQVETFTSVTFSLSTATDVALAASGTVFGTAPFGPRVIRLTGPGPSTLIQWNDFSFGQFPQVTGSQSANLTLVPGTYTLLVDFGGITSFSSTGGVNNVNVSLTELPEPGTLALALMGIIPALARRRR